MEVWKRKFMWKTLGTLSRCKETKRLVAIGIIINREISYCKSESKIYQIILWHTPCALFILDQTPQSLSKSKIETWIRISIKRGGSQVRKEVETWNGTNDLHLLGYSTIGISLSSHLLCTSDRSIHNNRRNWNHSFELRGNGRDINISARCQTQTEKKLGKQCCGVVL